MQDGIGEPPALFHSLANENRSLLLDQLSQSEKSVSASESSLNLHQATHS